MFLYEKGNKLYINLTNRCTNRCIFCIRDDVDNKEFGNLWIEREPEAHEIIKLIDTSKDYEETVFCGFGEPLVRLPEVIEISKHLKELNHKVRINTNGQANLIWKKSVARDFSGIIDAISISLNAASKEQYQKLCKCKYGMDAYDSIIEFAKECTIYVPKVIMSVVDIISKDEIKKCASIAKEIGAEFRVRHFS